MDNTPLSIMVHGWIEMGHSEGVCGGKCGVISAQVETFFLGVRDSLLRGNDGLGGDTALPRAKTGAAINTESFPRTRESWANKHQIPSCEGMTACGDAPLPWAKTRGLAI